MFLEYLAEASSERLGLGEILWAEPLMTDSVFLTDESRFSTSSLVSFGNSHFSRGLTVL